MSQILPKECVKNLFVDLLNTVLVFRENFRLNVVTSMINYATSFPYSILLFSQKHLRSFPGGRVLNLNVFGVAIKYDFVAAKSSLGRTVDDRIF